METFLSLNCILMQTTYRQLNLSYHALLLSLNRFRACDTSVISSEHTIIFFCGRAEEMNSEVKYSRRVPAAVESFNTERLMKNIIQFHCRIQCNKNCFEMLSMKILHIDRGGIAFS